MGWPVTVALSPVKALEITPRFEGVLVCSLTSSRSRAVLLDLSEGGRSKPALPSLCLVCWALPPPSEPQGVSVPGTASGWEQPWSQARAHGLALQHMEWAWKRRGAGERAPGEILRGWNELRWQIKTSWSCWSSNPAQLSCFSSVQPSCVWLELMRIRGQGTWERHSDPACLGRWCHPSVPPVLRTGSCPAPSGGVQRGPDELGRLLGLSK